MYVLRLIEEQNIGLKIVGVQIEKGCSSKPVL